MKKWILAVFLGLLMGLTGCATVQKGDPARDAELKKFMTKQKVAGVYIYRNEFMGGAVSMGVDIDGKPLGNTGAKTYLYTEVAPGKHKVTAKAENEDSLEFTAIAGKLHYIWQEVKMGVLYARTKLHLVDENAGKAGVLESSLAVMPEEVAQR